MSNQIILKLRENGSVRVVELQPIGDGHGRYVALLEGAFAGAANVDKVIHRLDQMAVPGFESIYFKGQDLLRFLFKL